MEHYGNRERVPRRTTFFVLFCCFLLSSLPFTIEREKGGEMRKHGKESKVQFSENKIFFKQGRNHVNLQHALLSSLDNALFEKIAEI